MSDLVNVSVPDLPLGYTPLEVVAVVKCLDETGEPTIAVRSSDGLMAWEAVGMLIAASDMARTDLTRELSYPDQEENEGDEVE